MKRADLAQGAAVFLIITLMLGATLRWLLAGFAMPGIDFAQWRHAHSHTGFYGVLFPLAWYSARRSGLWLPGKRLIQIYFLLCGLSIFGFITGGYGFVAKGGSFGILSIWLLFAYRNFKLPLKGWLDSLPISVAASAILIALIATIPDRSTLLSRVFLTILIFGVFVPLILSRLTDHSPQPFVWFLATVSSSLFLPGYSNSLWLAAGPVWIACELGLCIRSRLNVMDLRIAAMWSALAIGLSFASMGVLPRAFGIAGIHFLILGPILMSSVCCEISLRPLVRVGYETSMATMITAILLEMPLLSAISGTALGACVLWQTVIQIQTPPLPVRTSVWMEAG